MCPEGRCAEDGARVVSVVPSDSIRGKGLKRRSFPLNIGKHIFYCEVAQGSCELPGLGDIHKLPGHGAARVAVSRWPCLRGGIGPDSLQRSLPNSAVL